MAFEPPHIAGYEILGELGSGGMADVYLAVQTALDRRVAVKVMKRRTDDLEAMEKRFLVEARTLARLSHPNVVAIYDISKSADVTYFAMEYLTGGTLLDRMRQGIPLGEALSVVVQVANALEVAHQASIVHRDLKPSNIMFRGEHTPVITDFGVAKRSDQAHMTRLTQTGIMVGTPTYMSPEQINAIDIDGRSDQYSLGVMFFELLSGKPPFDAQTPIALLMAHLNTPMPDLPDDFKAFEPIIRRMLEKNPSDRFPSMLAFINELRELLIGDEALMGELRAHGGEHSASEQIRALGFGTSGNSLPRANIDATPSTTPSRRVGGVMVRSPSTPGASTSSRKVATTAASKRAPVAEPVVPPPSAPPPAARPLWLLPSLLAVAVAVIAIVIWLSLRTPGLDNSTRLLVDASLRQADGYLARGQLVEPAEESALAVLSAVYDQAPSYPPMQARINALSDALRREVGQLRDKRQFTNAEALLARAEPFSPLRTQVQAWRTELAAAQLAHANSERINALLKRADVALAANQVINNPPDDAYGLLLQAMKLDPQRADVKQRHDALRKTILAPIEARLKAGDVPAAQQLLEQSASRMSDGEDWQALQKALALAIDAKTLGARVDSLLAAARAREGAGQIVEPAGSSAVDAYLAAAALQPGNAVVEAALNGVAQRFLVEAQAAMKAGDPERALIAAAKVRRTKRMDAQGAAIEATAKAALGAQRGFILERLANAQQASADGRFFGSPQSAWELLNEVTAREPGNVAAVALLKSLPEAVAASARRQLELKQAPAAKALLTIALERYPNERILSSAMTLANAQIALDARIASQLQARMKFNQLLDNPPITEVTLQAAIGALATLTSLDPNAPELVALNTRLDAELTRAIAAAPDVAASKRLLPVLATLQTQLANPKRDQRLSAALAARAAALLAAEQQRLLALQGELVIQALPWGQVSQVLSATGERVTLPADVATPLKLRLPQGKYTVVVQSGMGTTPQTVTAMVSAQKSVEVTARFAAITPNAFLNAAGWRP